MKQLQTDNNRRTTCGATETTVLAAAARSPFEKFKKENEIQKADPKVERNPTCEKLLRMWRENIEHEVAMDLSKVVYAAKDVEELVPMLAAFEQEENFENDAGFFINQLIIAGPKERYTLHTDKLSKRLNGLGWGNTNHIIVIGDVGDSLGAFMCGGMIQVYGGSGNDVGRDMTGGRIEIFGNAGLDLGKYMRGGEIHVNGEYQSLSVPHGGKVFHNGKQVAGFEADAINEFMESHTYQEILHLYKQFADKIGCSPTGISETDSAETSVPDPWTHAITDNLPRGSYTVAYGLAEKLTRNNTLTPKDIELFCWTMEYLPCQLGLFLSAAINNGAYQDYLIPLGHMEGREEYGPMILGFRNTKNIRVEGKFRGELGTGMSAGRIVVLGTITGMVAHGMRDGEIHADGVIREELPSRVMGKAPKLGSMTRGGKIFSGGKQIWPKEGKTDGSA